MHTTETHGAHPFNAFLLPPQHLLKHVVLPLATALNHRDARRHLLLLLLLARALGGAIGSSSSTSSGAVCAALDGCCGVITVIGVVIARVVGVHLVVPVNWCDVCDMCVRIACVMCDV
jgi:hypothetical protein